MTFTRDLRRIQTAVYRRYFETDTTGLNIERLLVLEYLARAGAVYQIEIGRECVIDRSTMGPLLKVMADNGLLEVARDEENRRAKLVTITPKGAKVMQTARESLEAAESAVLDAGVHGTAARRSVGFLSKAILTLAPVDSRG